MKSTLIYLIIFSLIAMKSLWAATSDSISFTSNIDSVCEIALTPESIASNLDLSSSQSQLKIGRMNVGHNAPISIDIDWGPDNGALRHSSINNETFAIDAFHFEHIFNGTSMGVETLNFPLVSGDAGPYGEPFADLYTNFYISYTGIPALSLVQGTYSVTYTTTCVLDE